MTTATAVILELPYPPSVNHYWRSFRGIVCVSSEGKRYRRDVVTILVAKRLAMRIPREPFAGTLAVTIQVYPPDRRKRDLDNTLKATLDALAHAGIYADDSQIGRLWITRHEVVEAGKLIVTIEEHIPPLH